MPEVVTGHEAALAPLVARTPSGDCRHLKRQSAHSNGHLNAGLFESRRSGRVSTLPIAALAILEALRQVVGPEKLSGGFSANDCEGLVPAHLGRFLKQLCATDIIEQGSFPSHGFDKDNGGIYRLTNKPEHQQDFAQVNYLLGGSTNSDHDELWEVWLDYVVAESVAFVCSEAALLTTKSTLKIGSYARYSVLQLVSTVCGRFIQYLRSP